MNFPVEPVPKREVEEYVAKGLKAVTIPGAEPVFHRAGSTAFLILHGWCATAESVRFLTAGIAKGGYSVLAPTLPGHGTSAQDMLKFGPSDWINAARDALHMLDRHFHTVHLMGVSMGGTLALQLAALEADKLASVTTINAPVFLSNPQLAIDVMKGAPEGALANWSGPSFMGPEVAEIIYPRRSRKSTLDLFAMTALANEVLPAVQTSLLVIQSKHDPTVPPQCAEQIMAKTSSRTKKLQWLSNSYHTSQLDLDRDKVVAMALEFIRAQKISV